MSADVVIPVCGAPEAFARCLESVLTHTDLDRHGLILVLDGEQPASIERLVLALENPARRGVTILRNARRQGFVASVNRAMKASSRDVVLLNSDTQVPRRWVEQLAAAAASSPEIATVTPFSNNATICSLPRFLASNALPLGLDTDAFARRVEERSLRVYPRLPTGVGVCLYIKRRVLDQVGLFDESSFGPGYGEESDWCMRASEAGYVHVLDDATFVFHEGQRSFGPAREQRVRAAHRVMRRRHPEYLARVARFIREDPLRPLRERVLEGLTPRPAVGGGSPAGPRRVVHVVHGWPPYQHAGTEMYCSWLAAWQARRREVAVYARIADPLRGSGEATELLDRGGIRVRLVVNNFTARNPLARNALRDRGIERDFGRFLDEVRPELVHVHHLAGHGAGLIEVAARRRLPILYQVQDWWSVCARANLLDRDRRLCSGPGLGRCSRCLPLTGLPGAWLWNRALYLFRRRSLGRALRQAGALVMGSSALEASLRELGVLGPRASVHVLDYGVPRPGGDFSRRGRASPGGALRFGFIGSILPHKGVHLAVEAFGAIHPAQATLDVWGDTGIAPRYTAELEALAPTGAVRFHPPFPEERKDEVFASLDVLLVPSLGLESYGLAAREAMARGVPVLASRRGALAELFAGRDCGAHLDLDGPDGAAAIRAWVERLVAEPERIEAWRRNLPEIRAAEEHAEEIERLYERLLAGRGAGA
jgi:glycosyltransferase involved in cell wall biosynthesis/GT2 family glycosyltransferase